MPASVAQLGARLLGADGLRRLLNRTVLTAFASWRYGAVQLFAPANDSETWCDAFGYNFTRARDLAGRDANASSAAAPPAPVALDLGANVGDSAVQLYRAGLRGGDQVEEADAQCDEPPAGQHLRRRALRIVAAAGRDGLVADRHARQE